MKRKKNPFRLLWRLFRRRKKDPPKRWYPSTPEDIYMATRIENEAEKRNALRDVDNLINNALK